MIQLTDVTVQFGRTQALNPVNLEFHQGQFTVLLGPSGAGKSTLLRCINLMQSPTTGTVTNSVLGDLDLRKNLEAHRRQTGMIFQQHQLIPRLSALKNVMMGRLSYHSTWRSFFPLPRADQEIALQSLERVGLLDKALARVDELSGGQQQRVGIARALAQQPRFLIADEPVASLDPATAETVMQLLQSICQLNGIATIVSLHQTELALKYADRIIAIQAGHVILDAHPNDISPEQLRQLYYVSTLPDTGVESPALTAA